MRRKKRLSLRMLANLVGTRRPSCVIPAKAGIQVRLRLREGKRCTSQVFQNPPDGDIPTSHRLDSRLRGNDGTSGRRETSGRRAMTLVELMVVTGILLMLVAMSVPIVKPMLDSQPQSTGAGALSTYLNQARLRAMETGRPCGVRFERYTDLNDFTSDGDMVFPYNDACIIVRQVEVPAPYCGSSTHARVSVIGNTLSFHTWSNGRWIDDPAEKLFWDKMVRSGDKVQFNDQGPFYGVGSSNLPQISAASPASFKVLRSPKPTLAAPLGFPRGVVVDLEYSGENNYGFVLTGPVGADYIQYRGSNFHPRDAGDRDPITILFSPTGEVDSIIGSSPSMSNAVNSVSDQSGIGYNYGKSVPQGPIHLLVGRWERAGCDWEEREIGGIDVWCRQENSQYLPTDGFRNYKDASNFWVSIDHRNGLVRINEVASYLDPSWVSDNADKRPPMFNSREFAIESMGGVR